MTTKEAITLFKYYLQSNHKQRTIESYTLLLDRFNAIHAERALDVISPDEIFHFLEDLIRDLIKSTRRLRYAQMKAFYNFIIDRCTLNMRNPCNVSLLSKSFKAPKQLPHKILDRETVDDGKVGGGLRKPFSLSNSTFKVAHFITTGNKAFLLIF